MKLNLFSFSETVGATKELYIIFYKLVSSVYMYVYVLECPKRTQKRLPIFTHVSGIVIIHGRKPPEAKTLYKGLGANRLMYLIVLKLISFTIYYHFYRVSVNPDGLIRI